jgi:hypothetical protein
MINSNCRYDNEMKLMIMLAVILIKMIVVELVPSIMVGMIIGV